MLSIHRGKMLLYDFSLVWLINTKAVWEKKEIIAKMLLVPCLTVKAAQCNMEIIT